MTSTSDQSIGRSAASSSKFTIFEQVARVAVQTIQIYVLGRLLQIEDYGLIMMVQTFTGFTTVLQDFGFSNAAVQAKELTPQQSSNLFWLSSGFSFCIGVLFASLAPFIVWFYGKPELFWLAIVGSLIPVLSGLSGQPLALLKRNMSFGKLAIIRLIATIVACLVAIAFALLGFGPWALLFNAMTNSVILLIGAFAVTGFWPKPFRRKSGTRALVNYGGHFTAGSALGYLGRNADNVLIGSCFGDTALGLYSRAYALLMLPVVQLQGAIGQVNFAAFSKLQGDPSRFNKAAMRLLKVYLLISSLLVIPMMCASEDVVVVLLGPKWQAAGRVFLYLTPLAWIQLAGSVCTLAFKSSGCIAEFTKWSLFNNILAILGIASGIPWGVEGVALSYSITGLTIRYPFLVYSIHKTGYIDGREFFSILVSSALLAIPGLFVGLAVAYSLPDFGSLFRLSAVVLATSASIFVCTFLTRQGRRTLDEVQHFLSLLKSKTKTQKVVV